MTAITAEQFSAVVEILLERTNGWPHGDLVSGLIDGVDQREARITHLADTVRAIAAVFGS